MLTFFGSSRRVFLAAILLRVIFLFYGLWQDANSPLKYTDIDYYVFTDAARYIAEGLSPYERDTYRYTPLLAWMLIPTTWSPMWLSFGKVVFAVADIVAGWLIVLVLQSSSGMSRAKALKFASIWLLNPMVATISTRGSSEGLLGVMVVALLWAVLQRRFVVAGLLLGLGVHFKIYPFIYAPSIIWWMDDDRIAKPLVVDVPSATMDRSSNLYVSEQATALERALHFFNSARIQLAITSLVTFTILNVAMYTIYGYPFLQNTYLHHITRIDHRHNFSPYNTLLYLSSATPYSPTQIKLESLAFFPQLFLSAMALPLVLAKKDLPSTMLAQTFAFATFNKVCTSQYFLWYMVFLPFYMPISSLLSSKYLGISAVVCWIATQGLWLQQGFQLEFMGRSTFVPGLWIASLLFFLTNTWLLGIIVADVGRASNRASSKQMIKKVS